MDFLSYPVTKIGYAQPTVDSKMLERRQQLEEVMEVMRSNIQKLSERGDRLENLASRAEILDMTAAGYDHSSLNFVQDLEVKENRYKVILISFALFCFFCGIFLFK